MDESESTMNQEAGDPDAASPTPPEDTSQNIDAADQQEHTAEEEPHEPFTEEHKQASSTEDAPQTALSEPSTERNARSVVNNADGFAVKLLSDTSANSTTGNKSMKGATSIKNGKLTFTSAPHVHKAKPYERDDFSHSKYEVMKIGYENEVLVHKLTEIGVKPSLEAHRNTNPTTSPAGKPLPCYIAHSSVNRRKEADTIAAQNLQLYKRLQAIKPSKETSRETLAKSHKQNQAYSVNCSVFKPESM